MVRLTGDSEDSGHTWNPNQDGTRIIGIPFSRNRHSSGHANNSDPDFYGSSARNDVPTTVGWKASSSVSESEMLIRKENGTQSETYGTFPTRSSLKFTGNSITNVINSLRRKQQPQSAAFKRAMKTAANVANSINKLKSQLETTEAAQQSSLVDVFKTSFSTENATSSLERAAHVLDDLVVELQIINQYVAGKDEMISDLCELVAMTRGTALLGVTKFDAAMLKISNSVHISHGIPIDIQFRQLSAISELIQCPKLKNLFKVRATLLSHPSSNTTSFISGALSRPIVDVLHDFDGDFHDVLEALKVNTPLEIEEMVDDAQLRSWMVGLRVN